MLIPLPHIHAGLGQSTTQVQQMITQAASAYPNVPNLSDVALAVASHESGFQANAQNPGSTAAGVYQLLGVTQTTLGVTNPLDAQQNVNAGVSLLASYYQQYGNWDQALQAFSDGPGTVAAGTAPSSQTTGLINYVDSYSGGAVSSSPSVASSSSGESDNPVSDALGLSQFGVTDTGLTIGAACVAGLVFLSLIRPSPAYA